MKIGSEICRGLSFWEGVGGGGGLFWQGRWSYFQNFIVVCLMRWSRGEIIVSVVGEWCFNNLSRSHL